MTGWRIVPEEVSYGIVIYNFNENVDSKLKLTVGDTVHILEEEDNWYYGYIISNTDIKGIFPKSYVHVKKCLKIDKKGPTPVFVFREPPITKEISLIVREWAVHWKRLYVNHNADFEKVKTKIHELINIRSKIISGTLPTDELKKVTRLAAEEIDLGNNILDLDLIVRDQHGNLIDPEVTSTIQMYYQHKKATECMNNRSKPAEVKVVIPTAIQQYSNIFLVAVKNFTCKMNEDAELIMTLYDAKEYKSITENYIVRWTKEGLMSDLDQMYNLRVMFTDLGKRDLERERIFFVCQVVRIGSMETKEIDHRRSSTSLMSPRKNTSDNMRRPCGVAAMDITNYMSGLLQTDLEQEFAIPFINCEKDNLEQTLRKIINKSQEKFENKNQALFVSWKLLRGTLKQVREENPHLVLGNVSIARKMGFPEVILPGDVRNDLYLSILGGEFTKGNKSSDKNVEVVVKVCNKFGLPIPGVISLGGGVQPIDEYRSVIYYHEDKPQWHETFKIALPIEEFKTSHLTFTFKHRSSNEAKDKSEKPFAMAFVTLMQQNGTTLKDAKHNLIVYKIDNKKVTDSKLEYLDLPSKMSDVKDNEKFSVNGLSTNYKDSFSISSNICSTKLTQNVDLLGLLNWATHKETLRETLQALMVVDGEEVVKFLQDILDALFFILMGNQETDAYDTLIFECLLHIISLVSNDWKYQHFEPVLDLYIKENFSATLAYKKLIKVLKSIIRKPEEKRDLLFKTMKSLQYVMRFISESRRLYSQQQSVIDEDSNERFTESLEELLNDIITMMSSSLKILLREQGACLKYLPSTIPDILKVMDHRRLSCLLNEMLKRIPDKRLTKQKMMTINEIVHSKLFLYPECRKILLPVITSQVSTLFETNEEVELCIKIMSDIMELLFRKDVGRNYDDLKEIIRTVLRSAMQKHIKMERDNPHGANLVAVMLDIFRHMTDDHYKEYINNFSTDFDCLDFLMEILGVFKNLVNESIFPPDWCEMIMLQNHIILKSLKLFAKTINSKFTSEYFEYNAWSNFFHCAIAFMTQPALQLENFSFGKRVRIVNRYKDMRLESGFEIKKMWFNLGKNKAQFVPALVGLILEMTLIPESVLRKETIPIFFDMMQCEFYSSKLERESYGDTKYDPSHSKANFNDFENEMIQKLDTLFGCKGDEEYKNLFHDRMEELCKGHTALQTDGLKFVKIVTHLMESLLEYRNIINDESKENRMGCTVNLLYFYKEIGKKEMYIRYLNKLYDLHLMCDNYTEAAYTLELHTDLLNWSDEILSPLLANLKYGDMKTHKQLKEALYYTIIDNFSEGKMWECAIAKCQELRELFEAETFEYNKLSTLHKRMAVFYDSIMKITRLEPEYFKVGYYGRGFPVFLQNKEFVYRGKEYESIMDFRARIANQFPKAESLTKIFSPENDIKESDKQYIQIVKVSPVMEEKKQRFSGKRVADQIVDYYKVNNVQKFTFPRSYAKKDPDLNCDNDFASMWLETTNLTTKYPLPGILRWFPVENVTVEQISPLRNAIETIEKKNKSLVNIIKIYNREKTVDNNLGLTLTGILDANVMGGIRNYEEAFFSSNYEIIYPDDSVLITRLKDLLADMIPLLGLCLKIHKLGVTRDMQDLHNRLEERYYEMAKNIEEKYGKGSCDLRLDGEVQMRRHYSITDNSRVSAESVLQSNNTGDHSRVSTLTRNQGPSFRNFTSFNFTASSPALNSKNNHITQSKSLLLSPTKSQLSTPLMKSKTLKTPKEKRKSKDMNSISSNSSATQWYTSEDNNSISGIIPPTNGNVRIELTEELLPKRPLRAEVEKERRLSRPHSGQFSRPSSINVSVRGTSSGNSSNRDSVGTTDSSISEEDLAPPLIVKEEDLPPPLPAKQRDTMADYSNLPTTENVSFLYANRNTLTKTIVQIKVEAESIDDNFDIDKVLPPVPPPKPPKNKKK